MFLCSCSPSAPAYNKHSGGESVRKQSTEDVMSEQFDYLVVASGYFSAPCTPDIPGLSDFKERTIHSSALDDPQVLDGVLQESVAGTAGKLVVIGGSMSGAEAASALAFYLSSAMYTPSLLRRRLEEYEVIHICSKPFWTLPTYLPQTEPDGSETTLFLPLDLVLYNLDRRPPGPVQYSFGPLSAERIHSTNSAFLSMLGGNYETHGYFGCRRGEGEAEGPRPTSVAIGDGYAEFVRSKAILPIPGKVCAVNRSPSGPASIDITLSHGRKTTLDNVAAIITATGYTPYSSLAFLPEDVLTALEYLPTDPCLPLVLDGKGSTHAEIPNLGFIGFYKGPYWGVMEMQARLLGRRWARGEESFSESDRTRRAEERDAIRNLRNADAALYRAQLPMGDYTGLMESFARDLGMDRTQLSDKPGRHGPVVPARYTSPLDPSSELNSSHAKEQTETDIILDSLRATLNPNNTSPAIAMAIFRALHGSWHFTLICKDNETVQTGQSQKKSGAATFHPRYPTRPGYEREYLYEEEVEDTASVAETGNRSRAVYRLLDPLPRPDGLHIHIWMGDEVVEDEGSGFGLSLDPARKRPGCSGEYVVSGRSLEGSGLCGWEYVFYLEGVAVTHWECSAVRGGGMEIRTLFSRSDDA